MAIGVSGRSFSYGSPITTPARCGGALADQHVADRRNGPRRSQPRLRRHNIFKLKIGKRSVRDDVSHVAAIKKAVGDRGSVRVDVNQNWDEAQADLGCYHVPNIARKVLETFLDFHVPSNRSLHRKLEETDFDPHKKTAIYKFANDLSHHTGKSFDPALVAETQKNTIYLLEMIEAVAPLHYGGLKALAEA